MSAALLEDSRDYPYRINGLDIQNHIGSAVREVVKQTLARGASCGKLCQDRLDFRPPFPLINVVFCGLALSL
jgi:hypothetical protein